MALLSASAQIFDDFSDGNLNNNPSWEGDIDDFIVNNDLKLQLSAPAAGSSQIFLETSFQDSIEWEIDFEMDFSPSASNGLRIYLLSTSMDGNDGNAYFLEVGESGSSDALNFYRSDSGNSILLGTGTLGALGGSKATASLRVTLKQSGLWSFFTDYVGDGCKLLDFEVFDDTYSPALGQYFIIECYYTATRVDKFSFDNITVDILTPDTDGPEIANFEVLGPSTILIHYDEPVDDLNATILTNYSVDQGIGNPITAELLGNKSIQLSFGNSFESGLVYQMNVSGVQDLFGNEINDGSSFDFFLSESPVPGDLLINEILFNPYPGKMDFIEIYNSSSKFINLNGLWIENTQRDNDFIQVQENIFIEPSSYVAITEDIGLLDEDYELLFPERIVEYDLPAFNNDEGNVSLFSFIDGDKITIDSFNYDESYHYTLLFDVEGVSLERISLMGGSDDPQNWHSAAAVAGYATPGYVNSQSIERNSTLNDPFELNSTIFSPNNDGNSDLLIINYELEKPGYVVNMKIFDIKGRFIKYLSRNLLLGTSGFIKWDGTNGDSEKASLGIYILLVELIHPSGDINHFKKTCVLADFLN